MCIEFWGFELEFLSSDFGFGNKVVEFVQLLFGIPISFCFMRKKKWKVDKILTKKLKKNVKSK